MAAESRTDGRGGCYQAWSAPQRGQSTDVETPAEKAWPHAHA
jgi:hypothetical protein